MRAYSELYLEDAQACLGEMLDYATSSLEFDANRFFSLFITSGIARQFERGNPKYVGGMSGVELANAVLRHTDPRSDENAAGLSPYTCPLGKTSWYWTGWILAYYQWHSCIGFSQLIEYGLSPARVQTMYILHEADPQVFVDRANDIVASYRASAPTRLRTVRKARGMTQQQLAAASGTSLRMIQLYEQRQNSIDSAAGATLFRLSRALGCSMEDLLEEPMSERFEYAVVKL
ncbi:MAG: helix-turn-helix transcriptional regulator [Coriobacteriia bacterium]|nr:helix-turn-helix transcriptional regulator [Coriobacteriia bacterium]